MRILIIHNLMGHEALLRELLRGEAYDHIVCLGNVIGLVPGSMDDVGRLIRTGRMTCLTGTTEAELRTGAFSGWSSPFRITAAQACIAALSTSVRELLASAAHTWTTMGIMFSAWESLVAAQPDRCVITVPHTIPAGRALSLRRGSAWTEVNQTMVDMVCAPAEPAPLALYPGTLIQGMHVGDMRYGVMTITPDHGRNRRVACELRRLSSRHHTEDMIKQLRTIDGLNASIIDSMERRCQDVWGIGRT